MQKEQKPKKQRFEDYLNSKYNYTPYINEIGVMLPSTQTLILSNLINKLVDFNEEITLKKHYGRDYHFSFAQEKIFAKELGLAKQTFRDNLERLSEYVTFFCDRPKKNSGYKTTFFYLKLDAIRELFNEGAKKLGKEKKASENENKQVNNQPQHSKYESRKGTDKNVTNGLNTINENYMKYLNNEISKKEFNSICNPIESIINGLGYKIIENKELKKFELL